MAAHDNVNVRPKRRGEFLFGATKSFATVAAVVTAAGSSFGASAGAYVKGNTPPPNYNKRKGGGETVIERGVLRYSALMDGVGLSRERKAVLAETYLSLSQRLCYGSTLFMLRFDIVACNGKISVELDME